MCNLEGRTFLAFWNGCLKIYFTIFVLRIKDKDKWNGVLKLMIEIYFLSHVYFMNFIIYRAGALHSFTDDAVGSGHDSRIPFFTADITLSIPNVVSWTWIYLLSEMKKIIALKNFFHLHKFEIFVDGKNWIVQLHQYTCVSR